jgi:hypothetical protein
MSRRLTKVESRAIKRAMRAAPHISQRMDFGYVDGKGRFIIQSGGPIRGTLIEAVVTSDGQWTFRTLGTWHSNDESPLAAKSASLS